MCWQREEWALREARSRGSCTVRRVPEAAPACGERSRERAS